MVDKSVAFYDIEVFPNTFMVTFLYPGGDHDTWTVWHDDEKQIDQRVELFQFLKDDRTYIGFNSRGYDDQILAKTLQLGESISVREFNKQVYKHSKSIIANNNQWLRNPVKSIDLQRITKKGYESKSLKEIAINLRWPLIQDLPRNPHTPVPFEELEKLYLYNVNDCQITEALYKYIRMDIQLRINVTRQYKTNVMNMSNSRLGEKILEKMYAKEVGHNDFLNGRTNRGVMAMTDIINPEFDFSTEHMKKFLQQLRQESLHSDDEFEYKVRMGNLTYTMKKGGLHSEHDAPIIHKATETHGIWDLDVSSFYPFLMVVMGIRPEHLTSAFLKVLKRIIDQRIKAKADRKNMEFDERRRLQAHVDAEALKIAVNAVFGKLGSEAGWLYDPLALYRITINGQLLLLRLVEAVEGMGPDWRVIYANTDGISVYGPRSGIAALNNTCEQWERQFNLVLETVEFSKFVLRDVNNYLVVKTDGSVKAKGALNKDNLIEPDLMQGLMKKFEYPIVLEAIHNFFVEEKPIADTIKEGRDPLQFAISQKVGKTWDRVTYEEIRDFRIHSEEAQRTNRYAVALPRYGGMLYKWKGDRRQVAIKGAHLVLLNDLASESDARDKIYEPWYVREAEKVVAPFMQIQGELF